MEILMPQLGETVTEGKIIIWHRKVGDKVDAGDVLFELETDKVTMDVPATVAGEITAIFVNELAVAPVGAVVAILTVEGEEPSTYVAPVAAASPVVAPVKSASAASSAPQVRAPALPFDPFNSVRTPERLFGPARTKNGKYASPLARRLGALAEIDLCEVSGSGPHGRIVAQDVRDAMKAKETSTSASLASDAPFSQIAELFKGTTFTEIPLDGMRKTIARRLQESKQTVPHFYLVGDVDIDAMLALRQQINRTIAEKVSVNDFVVKAFAMALVRTPGANAVWANDRILQFHQADIGVAVAIEGGLITPVIRQADTKGIGAISSEIRQLAERARNRKLLPQDYQGGSASISNLGMYGVREFSAIINPPHATILAVGAGIRRPVEAEDGSVRFATIMTVTLSCDHRVVDGALGASLMAEFKKLLEQPFATLL